MTSTAPTKAAARSLFRALHREQRRGAVAPRTTAQRAQDPLPMYIKAALTGASTKAVAKERHAQLRDLELTLRSARIHSELLARYNPVYGQSEAERIRATARRVGWEVPLEYMGDGTVDVQGAAVPGDEAAGLQASRKKVEQLKEKYEDSEVTHRPKTGPLPPPDMDR